MIVGGAGYTLGPVLGAAVIVVLPELISSLAEYRLLVFGALLLVVLWLAPEGMLGTLARLLAAAPRRDRRATHGFDIAAFLGSRRPRRRWWSAVSPSPSAACARQPTWR